MVRRVLLALAALLLCSGIALAHPKGQTVLASWYGPGFEGRLMADGQRFRTNDPTIAAHRTLSLGTKLFVENPANGRCLAVIVKDRGPYVRGRDLDLSYAAAERLGYVSRGVARLVVVSRGLHGKRGSPSSSIAHTDAPFTAFLNKRTPSSGRPPRMAACACEPTTRESSSLSSNRTGKTTRRSSSSNSRPPHLGRLFLCLADFFENHLGERFDVFMITDAAHPQLPHFLQMEIF